MKIWVCFCKITFVFRVRHIKFLAQTNFLGTCRFVKNLEGTLAYCIYWYRHMVPVFPLKFLTNHRVPKKFDLSQKFSMPNSKSKASSLLQKQTNIFIKICILDTSITFWCSNLKKINLNLCKQLCALRCAPKKVAVLQKKIDLMGTMYGIVSIRPIFFGESVIF